MKFRVLASYLLLLFSAQLCSAAQLGGQQQLSNFLQTTQQLKATFIQTGLKTNNLTGNQPQGGTFYLSRPGRFRWSYHKPYQQEIVSNGKKVWFYDVDLEQVTSKTIDKALAMGPALLLSGDSSVGERFHIKELPGSGERAWVKLIPKEKTPGFRSTSIAFKQGHIVEMLLEDDFEQVTQIVFSAIQINPQLTPQLFEFTPPPGVDVIED